MTCAATAGKALCAVKYVHVHEKEHHPTESHANLERGMCNGFMDLQLGDLSIVIGRLNA